MKTPHAIYFNGTSYFVDVYETDHDKEGLKLIKEGYDLDTLAEEANSLNEKAYADRVQFLNKLYKKLYSPPIFVLNVREETLLT